MGLGQYVGFMFTLILLQTCPASGRPSSNLKNGHEVQKGTKECVLKFSLNVSQGDSASLTLPIATENMISVSHYEFQKHSETVLLLGSLHHLNKHGNKTEVSLINHTFTLQKVKKADEGLYRIKEYKEERCLALVNVTVFDPPPSPATTNLPNANVSFTPTLFPPEWNILGCVTCVVLVVVFVSVIIILAVLVYCLKQKRNGYTNEGIFQSRQCCFPVFLRRTFLNRGEDRSHTSSVKEKEEDSCHKDISLLS